MNKSWERLVAWTVALVTLVALAISIILILLFPAGQDIRAWEYLVGALVGCGAPILGLVILGKQPRNRIGWLWLVIGLTIAFVSLSQGLKYYANSSPTAGYSSLLFTFLLFGDTAYVIRFICFMLMMLWFPDGKPPSSRWRILHVWVILAFILLSLELFAQQVPFSDVDGLQFGLPLVDNPIGFLPVSLNPLYQLVAPVGFLSIIGMLLLAALSMLLRYRSATMQVRAQIRWFVVGGVIYVTCLLASLVLMDYSDVLPGILSNLAILPLYLAIGIAITRYRLYDIDLIIRKTLQYTLITGLLVLVYFGSVLILQNLVEALTGEQSPVVIVISTLGIAALFNPLRKRIQEFIDRRFYRKKYDAEHTLAHFTTAARDEVNLEQLSTALLSAVGDTMQPEMISLWLKSTNHSPSQLIEQDGVLTGVE